MAVVSQDTFHSTSLVYQAANAVLSRRPAPSVQQSGPSARKLRFYYTMVPDYPNPQC